MCLARHLTSSLLSLPFFSSPVFPPWCVAEVRLSFEASHVWMEGHALPHPPSRPLLPRLRIHSSTPSPRQPPHSNSAHLFEGYETAWAAASIVYQCKGLLRDNACTRVYVSATSTSHTSFSLSPVTPSVTPPSVLHLTCFPFLSASHLCYYFMLYHAI